MTKRVWKKGPPPHVGWWNASTCKNLSVWRWWNGRCWSGFALDHATPKEAATIAARRSGGWPALIEWTDYWPENARVPRVKP